MSPTPPLPLPPVARRFTGSLLTVLLAASLLVVVPVVTAGPAAADAADDFTLAKADNVGGEALIGEHVTYTLTATGSQSSADYLYNLSFSDTLPEHVAYLSADPAPTAILADVPAAGQTTLIWENVADLPANSQASVSYTIDTNPDHVPGTFIGSDTLPVGDSIHNEARAAASQDPFLIPDWSPTTGLFTAEFDGDASISHDTLLIPFRVTKTGPDELLRGVHANGVDAGASGSEGEVFQVEVENNPDYDTATLSLVDTLDPKLEFQGCQSYYAGDNSVSVVEEWLGSGPVATAALTCDTPDTVETSAVGETIVTWTLPDLAPADIHVVEYQAGFPLWANVAWSDPTDPYLDPAGLNQGRNLDNNTGASTGELDSAPDTDPELLTAGEQSAPNLAEVTGTYTPTATEYTFDDLHVTEAEDIVIAKSMSGALVQQSLVNTTLTITTGEYRDFTELVVRDLLPSPLCFLGTYNGDLSPTTDWRDTDCTGHAGTPSVLDGSAAPVFTVRELPTGGPYGTGRFELVWDHSDPSGDNDALDVLDADQSLVITYTARVRGTYRRNYLALPGEQVLAGDTVGNQVEVSGPDFVASPVLPDPDPVDPDGGIDGDTSSAGLANSLPSINKRISAKAGAVLADGAGATKDTCVDEHSTGNITWVEGDPDAVRGFGPGDIVCFELNADFPAAFDYEGTVIQDILPPSYTYIADSAARAPGDTIDGTTVSGTGPITFTLNGDGNVDETGNTFTWVIAATILEPDPGVALDIDANLEKMIHNNNGGLVYQYRDQSNAEHTEPQARLAKGVEFVDSADDGIDAGPNDADWDGSLTGTPTGAEVQADARVGYRVDVWNTGNKDALDAVIWDVLPPGFTCVDHVDTASISNLGSCVTDAAGDYIEWTGIDIAGSVDSAIADTTPDDETTAPVTLRYELNVPDSVDAGEVYENHAGIRSYEADINTDALAIGRDRFIYYPADNIDTTATAPTSNTDAADDVATLFTAAPTLDIAQLSAVDETGNVATGGDTDEQLTIGEIVEYTVTLAIPEGTSVYDGVITVPLPPGTVFFDDTGAFGGVVGALNPSVTSTDTDLFATPLGSGTATWPADGSTDDIVYTLPTTYRNEVGDDSDTVTLTFYAQVVDDVAANQADPDPATTFDATATFAWNDVDSTPRPTLDSNTVTSEVVEPNPQVDKTHTDPIGNDVLPGQTITYQITASNPTAGVNNVSVAHDVVLVDHVPVGATPFNSPGTPVSGPTDTVATIGAPAGTWNEAARTITWTLPGSIIPDDSVVFTYDVGVDDPALASGTIENTVDLTAKSLDGDLDPNIADARTYTDDDVDRLDLPLASSTKDVEPFNPGDPADDRDDFAVGEEVDFQLEVTIPAGSIVFDLTMFDQLPAGFVFDSFGAPVVTGPCEVWDAGADASTGTAILPSEIERLTDVGGDTQRIAFFLGDLVSPSTACVITLPYTVIVASGGVSGVDITNEATLSWNQEDHVGDAPTSLPAGYDDPASTSWDRDDTPLPETITVIEPQLELDLDVGPGLIGPICNTTPGDNNTAPDGDDLDGIPTNGCDTEPGAVLVNTVTVTNTGTADAYDTDVVVTVPIGLTVTDFGGGTWNAGARTITWDIAGPIVAGGAPVTLVYETELDPSDSLADGQNLTTDADIPTYYGLVAAERTNAEVPTYGNASTPLRGSLLADQTTVQIHMPELGVTKMPATGQDPSDVRFDQPFTWEITIENTASVASAFDVDAVDVLPDGWTYVPNSAMVTTPYAAATQVEPGCVAVGGCNQPASTNAETLTWTPLVSGSTEPLAPGAQIVITLDAIPQSAALAPDQTTGELFTGGFAHTNTVAVSGEDASGSASCCDPDGAGGLPAVAYSDTATDDVFIRRADIEVAKTIDPAAGPHWFGSFVEYTVTVSNVGPDDATGVDVADVLAGTGLVFDSVVTIPLGTSFVEIGGSGSGDWGTWEVGDIASGVSLDLRIRTRLGQVNDPADPNDRTVNFAEALAADQYDSDSMPDNGDPDLATEDDEARVSVTALPSTLGDFVWLDLNQDGVQDAGEPGIPGVEVAISWTDPLDGSTQNRTVTTNAMGAYGFPESAGLPVSLPITIAFDTTQAPLAGLDPTWDYGTFLANGGTDPSDPLQIPLGLNSASIPVGFDVTIDPADIDPGLGIPADLQVDFGFVGTYSLGDEVWWDVDANAAIAPNGDDFVLPDVTVNGTWAGWDGILDDDPATGAIDESADNLVFTDITDGAGLYLLADLPPGLYGVEVDPTTLPPGLTTPTFDFDGLGTPNASEVALTADDPTTLIIDEANRRDQDFSYTGPGRIGDTVWFDHDGDGVQDPGEPGLAGATVTIDWTHPTDATITHSFSVVTDADGMFDVTGLPYGDFVVSVDPSTLPGNVTPTHDADDTADGGIVTGTPGASAITLDSGAPTSLDQDFGYRGLGRIGDDVFYDVDATETDGTPDAADIPLEDVDVTVTWGGVDGVVGDDPATLAVDESADDFSTTVMTLADGSYIVDSLPLGNYEIVVDTATLPPGMIPTFDFDGTAGASASTSATALTVATPEDLDQDFSYTGQGSIGDTIWYDYDGDGVIDSIANGDAFDEVGIGDITVDLTWAGSDGALNTPDDVTFTTVTAGDGTYLFENLPFSPAGVDTYIVTVDTADADFPLGLAATFDDDGLATLDNSTLELSSSPGEDLDQDFGYTGVASLGDTVWMDLDNSGTPDQDLADPTAGLPAEPGIPGVEVTITWDNPDPDGTDFVIRTTTDLDGNYTVPSLPYGDFTVEVTGSIPVGLSQTYGPAGATNPVSPVSLAADDPATLAVDEANRVDQDFSFAGAARLGDTVWFDQDNGGDPDPAGSGVFDDEDQPLQNVGLTVTWAGFDGIAGDDPATALVDESADDLVFTPVTDANGEYLVEYLPVGDYRIEVDTATLPLGIDVPTFDFDGIDTPSASSTSLAVDDPATIGVDESEDLDQDFSYTGVATLGDTVWFDFDGDGEIGSDEVGLAGVTVTLTYIGPDGTDVAVVTTTGTDGMYLFENVPFDTVLTVTITDVPPGFVPVFDQDGIDTPNVSTTTLTDVTPDDLDQDFGYRGNGSLGDTVWYDRDDTGAPIPDAGDVGIPDVDVTIVWTNPTGGPDFTTTVTTDSDGMYLLTGLPHGDYTVTVDPSTLPTGTVPTYDADGIDTPLTSMTTLDGVTPDDLDQDFSVTGTGSIGDTVWKDDDADGVFDVDESPIAGVTVTLTYVDPVSGLAFTDTTITDTDGVYLFDDLPAGAYTITVDTDSLPGGYFETFDVDGLTTPHVSTLDLGDGEERVDVDFGYRPEADLSLVKTHVGDFTIGSTNTWTLTVANVGPAAAEAPVTITDSLPANVTYVDSVGDDWACTVAVAAVTCTYVDDTGVAIDLDEATTTSVGITVSVDAGAAPGVSNTATVATPTYDTNPENDSDDDDAEVPLSILAMDKSLDGRLEAGRTATYVLTVTNLGPTATRGDVVVTDDLPAGLRYTTAASDIAGATCSEAAGTVTCTNPATMAVGDTWTIDLEVQVTAAAGTRIGNIATVDGGNEVNGVPLAPETTADIYTQLGDPLSPLYSELGITPDATPGDADTSQEVVEAPRSSLPFTGASSGRLALFGLAVLAWGMALVAVSQRRRRLLG